LETRRINAMRLVYKIKPDSRGFMRAIQFFAGKKIGSPGSYAIASDRVMTDVVLVRLRVSAC